jgi:hypothetical protein
MQLWQTRLFLAGLVLAAGLGTQTARAEVNFSCGSPYAEIPLGEFVHEFPSTIASDVLGGEEVHLRVNAVLPSGWAWQVCQTSTGICYITESIDLTVPFVQQDPDTLRFDIFPNPGVAGVGYLQIEMQRSEDPLDLSYCTVTLFNGLEDPEVQWDIDCTDNTYFTTTELIKEFHCPIVLENPLEDMITIRPTADMPAGWAWQFCQTSTGICYFTEATIPLTIGVDDTLRVDFFMSGNGRGSIDLELFSESNPSVWRRCYYRVFRGNFPSDVPDVAQGIPSIASYAQPNPFQESTALRFELQSDGRAELAVYSADGRAVRTYRDLAVFAGEFEVSWDGRDDSGVALPAGVYYYRLTTASEEAKGVMVRTR